MEIVTDRITATGPWLSSVRDWSAEAAGQILAFDLSVPDVALVSAFALAVVATLLSQRGRSEFARGEVEELYRAELLTANRRAQQARGELRNAKQAIERERQKRRREAASQKPNTRFKTLPTALRRSDALFGSEICQSHLRLF